MQWLVALLLAGAVTNPAQITFSHDSTQSSRRALSDKLSDNISVKDAPFLAKGDGSSLDASAINTAIALGQNTIYLPASTHCYNLGNSTLMMAAGVTVRGAGYGSPGLGATCLNYTGTGCAVLFDSVSRAALLDLDIQLNTTSSTAAGVCYASTTNVAEWNRVENVSITPVIARTTGQIGLWLEDTGNGVFLNRFSNITFRFFDVSLYMHATGTTQGVNDNRFFDINSYAHNTAYILRAGNKQISDNKFYGLFCQRADATMVGTATCLLMGDDNVAGVFGNSVYGLTSDQGAPSVCGVLGTTSGANLVEAICESGGGFVDNAGPTTSSFGNRVYNQTSNGAFVGQLSIPNLITTRGAQLSATIVNGVLGGGTSGAGGVLQIQGGAASSAATAGGDLQLTGGVGAASNGNSGNVLIAPGARTGTGLSGTVVIGPSSGQSSSSGLRIRSARVTIANKPFAATDCAAANLTPNVSLTLDDSIFTCATAQTVTMPSAQGAAGLVQSLPTMAGAVTAVGDIFEFQLVSTAAANFTLVGGVGTTIVGNAAVNNSGRIVRCRVTSVTSGSETLTCYL